MYTLTYTLYLIHQSHHHSDIQSYYCNAAIPVPMIVFAVVQKFQKKLERRETYKKKRKRNDLLNPRLLICLPFRDNHPYCMRQTLHRNQLATQEIHSRSFSESRSFLRKMTRSPMIGPSKNSTLLLIVFPIWVALAHWPYWSQPWR